MAFFPQSEKKKKLSTERSQLPWFVLYWKSVWPFIVLYYLWWRVETVQQMRHKFILYIRSSEHQQHVQTRSKNGI